MFQGGRKQDIDLAAVEEIAGVLESGGYFRARIHGLSPFDKLAGGLAWAIRASREAIDCDFIEDAQIGHQIQVGENIENALHKMHGAPALTSFQIRGLDCPKIRPVIVWLLKIVVLVREEMARSLRDYTRLRFQRNFGMFPHEVKVKEPLVLAPERQFRRAEQTQWDSIEDHVYSVLLEYGMKSKLVQETAEQNLEGEDEEKKISEDERRQQSAKAAANMARLQGGLVGGEMLAKVSKTTIRSAFMQDQANLQAYAAEFNEKQERLQKELEAEEAGKNLIVRLEAQLEEMQTDVEAQQARKAKIEKKQAKVQEAVEGTQKGVAKVSRKKQKIESAMEEIGGQLDQAKQTVLKELEGLIQQNEDLKEEKEKVTKECKTKLGEWKQKMEAIEEASGGVAIEETDEFQKQAAALEAEETKFTKAMSEISKQNRKLALIEQEIDKIPTRLELVQYERRFTELYEQVRWKFEETKQHYNRYNTLTETTNFLRKQMDLFNSIHQQYDGAMTNKGTREEFPGSIEKIVESVSTSLGKSTDKLDVQKQIVAKATEEYNALMTEQRNYFVNVKHFKEECEKNKTLEEKLEKAKRKAGIE